MEFPAPIVYKEHEGTIRVSARHTALPLAKTINEALERHRTVDLVYMGAQAGHVAIKAVTIVEYQLQGTHHVTPAAVSVLLQPFKVQVRVSSAEWAAAERDETLAATREATVLRIWRLQLPRPDLLDPQPSESLPVNPKVE